jgi:hypothetical protein
MSVADSPIRSSVVRGKVAKLTTTASKACIESTGSSRTGISRPLDVETRRGLSAQVAAGEYQEAVCGRRADLRTGIGKRAPNSWRKTVHI